MIWHLFGTVAVLISFPFIFNPCPFVPLDVALNGHWSLVMYYTPFIVIFQIGWAAVQTAHLSLISDLTESAFLRTLLNSIRYSNNINKKIRTALSLLAGLSIYFSFFFLLHDNGKQQPLKKQDYLIFRYISLGSTVVGAVFSFLHHLLLREPRENLYENSQTNQIDYMDWIKCATFYRISAIYALARVVANIYQIYIILYLLEIQSFSKSIIALAPLTIYLFGFFTSFCMSYLLNKISPEVLV
uniref:Major facilitator superfamily domain-containing protein 12 (Trinotate prediction) n=1 Tax=Henneguya salminicola TaxID=69463 RepID=A0A6G3MHT8_HENSL